MSHHMGVHVEVTSHLGHPNHPRWKHTRWMCHTSTNMFQHFKISTLMSQHVPTLMLIYGDMSAQVPHTTTTLVISSQVHSRWKLTRWNSHTATNMSTHLLHVHTHVPTHPHTWGIMVRQNPIPWVISPWGYLSCPLGWEKEDEGDDEMR
jgi:hypothetical protein